MRLEYMISSTLPIQFRLAGRAEFRPASYPSKLRENAADFRLGPYDDSLRDRRILRGHGIRSGQRFHAALPAATWHRARSGRLLGGRDRIVLQRHWSAVPAVLGRTRRPLRAEAADHPIVCRRVRRTVTDRDRAERVDLRHRPRPSVARSRQHRPHPRNDRRARACGSRRVRVRDRERREPDGRLHRSPGRRTHRRPIRFSGPHGSRCRDHARPRRDAGPRLPRWVRREGNWRLTPAHGRRRHPIDRPLATAARALSRPLPPVRGLDARVHLRPARRRAPLHRPGPEHRGRDRVRRGRARGPHPFTVDRRDRRSIWEGANTLHRVCRARSDLVRTVLDARSRAVHGRVDRRERPRGGALQRLVHTAVRVGDPCDERPCHDLRVPARQHRLRNRAGHRQRHRLGRRVPRVPDGRGAYAPRASRRDIRLAAASWPPRRLTSSRYRPRARRKTAASTIHATTTRIETAPVWRYLRTAGRSDRMIEALTIAAAKPTPAPIAPPTNTSRIGSPSHAISYHWKARTTRTC